LHDVTSTTEAMRYSGREVHRRLADVAYWRHKIKPMLKTNASIEF